ncbi:MAG: DUF2066 domain-containing protein [Alphaproteobacteria bacterium]|nr:DUF2066 domain-containing protein [Alphaproteobacteria bacterium]
MLIAAVLLLLTGIAPATADDQDQFSATVPVDATAESPAKAREMALLDGQRRALAAVAEHLSNGGTPVKVPKLDDKAITNLVTSFDVVHEHTSAVRYTADYTFHFRPGETRRLLGVSANANTAAGATAGPSAGGNPVAGSAPNAPDQSADTGKPIVVLPVYQAGAQGPARLWDEPNPWREAWDQHPPNVGVQHVIVPLGDAGDVATIDADKARSGDAAALSAIAKHNGADEALVAVASLQGPADKPSSIDIAVRRYRGGQLADSHSDSVTANPGETSDAMVSRAVATVGADIAGGWKKDTSARADQEGSLTAVLPITGLDDWVHARDRIAAVSLVRKISLVALSRQEATIEIGYKGSIDQLKDAFAGINLTLARGNPMWRLSRAEPSHTQ